MIMICSHDTMALAMGTFALAFAMDTKALLQKVCAAYVTCVDHFKTLVPTGFSDAALREINKAFLVTTKVRSEPITVKSMDVLMLNHNLGSRCDMETQTLLPCWSQLCHHRI